MKARLLSAAACLFLVSPLFAQGDRGTFVGTITDATGAVVPGARISVTHASTNVSTSAASAESGDFSAVSLPVGIYTIRVEKEGFKPSVRNGVTLAASATVRVDFKLEVGTAQQTVEVNADVEQLMTENAKTNVNVSNKLVDELPLVVGGAMRSPFDLATLTPETKNYGDNNFSIGGGQAASYGITLDGTSAATTRALQTSWISYNAPSLEMITEFTVDSNGFKAEYGHAAGGLMSFVTKSGTNEFHGSAYEFLRNDKLDARRFFEAKRGVYKQHNFGASAGGPVYIPKIINGKNKTFFFAAYEGFRNRVGSATTSASVPAEEMYRGDFSNWVNAAGVRIPIYDPTTLSADRSSRQPFPNNQVPQARFDPNSTKLLGVYQSGPGGVLKPNTGAAPGTSAYVRSNFLITQGVELNPWTKFDIKGDHVFNSNHRLSGFFGYHRIYKNPGAFGAPNQLPGYYTGYNDSRNLSDVYRMSWDWTVRPTLLNRFYAGGNNWRESHYSPNELLGNWKDKFCLNNVPICNNNLSALGFSEYNGWGGTSNNGSENTVFSFHDDLTWIKGKHTFKFGGMFQRNHYNGFGQQWDAGFSNFSFTGTGRPGDTNFSTAGGNSFASFLLGHVNNGQIHTVRFISQQWPYFAGFAQDDYRLSRRLTLNVGLRWETTLPPVESKDRWSDFSPTRPNPAADNIPGALVFAGTYQGAEGTRSLAGSYYRAFGPHIGFAFSMNDKTVVRSAYSRSFGAITTVTGSTHFLGHVQIFDAVNFSSGIEPAYQFRNGFPTYPIPPFINPSFGNGNNVPWWQGNEATKPPVNDTWTLSIQRQLPSNTLVEVAYNGLAGSHLQSQNLVYNQVPFSAFQRYGRDLMNRNINDPLVVATGVRKPFSSFNSTLAQALRPFPQYQNIDTASGGGDHSGHSTYHALMLRMDKRASSGLTVQTSYVLSKILTDSDSYWPGAASLDHYNRRLEKSIGQFDATHNFKLSYIYELPFGKGKRYALGGSKIADVLFGGWRVSAIHLYSSGLPVTIGAAVGFPIFNGSNRATASTFEGWRGAQAGSQFDPQTDRFFQPASFFGVQPQDRLGNITRFNPKLRLFPSYAENFSFAKTFGLTEKIRMNFRWEAFNLFNRVRFGTGPNGLTNPNFGRLTGNQDILLDPRRMQVALKLYW
jgi:hypothetical protein